MAVIDDLKVLTEIDDRLYPLRLGSAAAWEMSKASMWMKSFAETLVRDDDDTDYPGGAADMEDYMREVQAAHGAALDGNADYALVFSIGKRLVAICLRRAVNPDGFLGSVKVIKEQFSFLCANYGFVLTKARIRYAAYTRDPVTVTLRLPRVGNSDCYIKMRSIRM